MYLNWHKNAYFTLHAGTEETHISLCIFAAFICLKSIPPFTAMLIPINAPVLLISPLNCFQNNSMLTHRSLDHVDLC